MYRVESIKKEVVTQRRIVRFVKVQNLVFRSVFSNFLAKFYEPLVIAVVSYKRNGQLEQHIVGLVSLRCLKL